MLPLVPVKESLLVFGAIAAIDLGFVCSLRGRPHLRRSLGWALFATGAVLAGAHAAWAYGGDLGSQAASYWGATIATGTLVVLGLATLTLPLLALVNVVVGPRSVVPIFALLLPLLAGSCGVWGFAKGAAKPTVPVIEMSYPNLPDDLDGLRILQLSDLHLGVAMHARDLEELLAGLDHEPHRPDLIVFTGDVAEDAAELAPALTIAKRFHPRLGVYASLGNHEYLRDIHVTRPIYEASGVPLLVDRGVTIPVGHALLYIAGTDDPVRMAGIGPFMQRTVDRAMHDRPSGSFALLLSHRPEGFDRAAELGTELTLSGHTHGGQIGFGGKSVLARFSKGRYLWGAAEKHGAHLYTTSGFGSWFPFRLGCRAEAPIIVLRSGSNGHPSSFPRPQA